MLQSDAGACGEGREAGAGAGAGGEDGLRGEGSGGGRAEAMVEGDFEF